MKNPFKRFNKQKVSIKPKVPRTTEELTKAYQDLAARAAQSQYLVYVHTRALEDVNEQMMAVNQEAAERQKLDKAALPKENTNVKA